MPIHPAPPEDLPGMVEAFGQTVQGVIDLGHSCRPEDFALPTACPGWTVQDHISHIAAVEDYLEGAEYEEGELAERGHLRHEFGVWMEHGVEARRRFPGPAVVSELETLLQARMTALSDPELTLDSEVRAPMGTTMPLRDLLRIRINDTWVHQQDLREALGRPGDLDTGAAATFVNTIVEHFPALVAKRVELPEGGVVILDCTGPVTARAGVRLVRAEDGSLLTHPLFTGESDTVGEDTTQVHEVASSTTIVLSTDALTRRAAGRRPTSETAYRVVGDEELAARVLDAIVITP
jgi:uncharacterized protein (TIGR03083 family)